MLNTTVTLLAEAPKSLTNGDKVITAVVIAIMIAGALVMIEGFRKMEPFHKVIVVIAFITIIVGTLATVVQASK
jgi:fructose-specific phosphotransferase system IIC component